jgi:glycosyltransferase involved in cell wall biosynthesis
VLDIKNPFMGRIATAISHWHYRRADKLIALSERMRNQLLKITNKPEGSIIVLPQAAEKLYETPIKDSALEKRFKSTFNVVFTGNISPAQSFPTMIEAAEILKKKGLDDIRWVIVGDGMSRRDVQQEVEKRGLSDTFIFEGQKPVADVPKYTNIGDVLVGCLVKSDLLEATIPAKVMSYIASGKPIVLSMDGEVQDLINNEIKCGYVSNTDDAGALAENIERVYKASSAERKSMGTRARKYHFEHFERNLLLKKLEQFMLSGNKV